MSLESSDKYLYAVRCRCCGFLPFSSGSSSSSLPKLCLSVSNAISLNAGDWESPCTITWSHILWSENEGIRYDSGSSAKDSFIVGLGINHGWRHRNLRSTHLVIKER